MDGTNSENMRTMTSDERLARANDDGDRNAQRATSDERLARISAMEEALNRASDAIEQLERSLDRFEATQKDIAQIDAYYGSATWFDDRNADETGALPTDLKRGVLTEDLAYNMLEEHHDLLVRMQNVAAGASREETPTCAQAKPAAEEASRASSWAEANDDLAAIMRAGREELKAQTFEISSCPVSILQRHKPSR